MSILTSSFSLQTRVPAGGDPGEVQSPDMSRSCSGVLGGHLS